MKNDITYLLSWWLLYFSNGTDKFKIPHPNFKDDPTGFDETVIEQDLLSASMEITTLRNKSIQDDIRITILQEKIFMLENRIDTP